MRKDISRRQPLKDGPLDLLPDFTHHEGIQKERSTAKWLHNFYEHQVKWYARPGDPDEEMHGGMATKEGSYDDKMKERHEYVEPSVKGGGKGFFWRGEQFIGRRLNYSMMYDPKYKPHTDHETVSSFVDWVSQRADIIEEEAELATRNIQCSDIESFITKQGNDKTKWSAMMRRMFARGDNIEDLEPGRDSAVHNFYETMKKGKLTFEALQVYAAWRRKFSRKTNEEKILDMLQNSI